MKASEVEVGKVYFSSTNPNWQYSGWGASKVRLKDATHAFWYYDRAAKDYRSMSSKSFRSTKGVLVERLNESTGQVMETCVVTLASIKGLWDVVKPVVDSNRAEREKAEEAQQKAISESFKAVEVNFQRAKELGLVGVGTRLTENTIAPQTLAMLLDLWQTTREA